MLTDDKIIILTPLFAILNAIRPISEPLKVALIDSFDINTFKKKELLLKEGDVCENLYFLDNGILRSFHSIAEKEITSRIMFKNHIVISSGSFFKQTFSTESIEAITDTTVAALPFIKLQQIYLRFEEFNFHARLITEDYFYKQEQRLYMLRQADVRLRYQYFVENYSEYFNVISLKYLASFLNVSRETLSRLRNGS